MTMWSRLKAWFLRKENRMSTETSYVPTVEPVRTKTAAKRVEKDNHMDIADPGLRGEDIFGIPVREGPMWSHEYALTVTPDMAKKLLAIMQNNRPLRPGGVKFFVELIKSGRFDTTSQGISFDEFGKTLSGQHRLHACIETNTPIKVQVTFNEPRKNFRSHDRGIPRSIATDFHQLGLVKNPMHAPGVSSTCKFLLAYDVVLDMQEAESNFKPALDDLAYMMTKYQKVEGTFEWARASAQTLRFPSAHLAALFTLFRFVDDEKAWSFAQQISRQEGLYEGYPAKTFYDAQVRSGNPKTKKGRRISMFRLIYAWNAFYEGRTARVLTTAAKGNREDTLPRISGLPPQRRGNVLRPKVA
jgi:hypothetical protein